MVTETRPKLIIVPCTLERANAVIAALHRHHQPIRTGFKLALAVADESGATRGVCIVGHPVARYLNDGYTLEVRRVATDGCPNACSALYGAARRVSKVLGYRRLITYTLPQEGGASLRGAGWTMVRETTGDTWERPNRKRVDRGPTGPKWRWEVLLHG